jgi:hypothetical protein
MEEKYKKMLVIGGFGLSAAGRQTTESERVGVLKVRPKI